jgi:WD40 repeat protein
MAFYQWRQAHRHAVIADAQSLGAHSRLLVPTKPQQSLILAVEAIRATRNLGMPVVPAAEQAVQDALSSIGGRPLSSPASPIGGLAFTRDGRLVSGHRDGTVRVWDLNNPSAQHRLIGRHEEAIYALALAPDGRLVSGGGDKTARVWDLDRLAAQPRVLHGHESAISTLVFAADNRLVTGS